MDEKELLKAYHEALASGRWTLAEINAEIEVATGGRHKSYASLAKSVFQVEEGREEVRAAERVSTRQPGVAELAVSGLIDKLGGGPGAPDIDLARGVGDVSRLALHEASFGLSDELADLIPGGMTSGDVRQRISDLETVEPTGAALARMAGAAAVPGIAGGAAMGTGTGLLSRVSRGMLATGGAGAIAGGATGFGEGTDMEGRIEGAKRGAITGGLFGIGIGALSVPVAGILARVGRGGRGGRLARDIRKAGGIEDELEAAFARADAHVNRVSAELYKPLDRAFDSVDDSGVLEALMDPELKTIVRSVSKEVANGKRAPSFEELQTIRNKARARRGTSPATADAGDTLSQEMQRAIPGLRDADREYARALELAEGLEAGYSWANLTARSKSATLARRAMAEFGDEGQEAFREGMIHGFVDQLQNRKANPAIVQQLLDMGPEMRARLRNGFPNEEAFEDFLEIVATEKTAAGFARRAQKFVKWILIGGIAGGAGYGGARAFRGGEE